MYSFCSIIVDVLIFTIWSKSLYLQCALCSPEKIQKILNKTLPAAWFVNQKNQWSVKTHTCRQHPCYQQQWLAYLELVKFTIINSKTMYSRYTQYARENFLYIRCVLDCCYSIASIYNIRMHSIKLALCILYYIGLYTKDFYEYFLKSYMMYMSSG